MPTCVVSRTSFHELDDELLPHLLYFPKSAPSDYFVIPDFKKGWEEKDEISLWKIDNFEYLDQSYLERVKKFKKYWTKCMELKKETGEKQKVFLSRKMCFIQKIILVSWNALWEIKVTIILNLFYILQIFCVFLVDYIELSTVYLRPLVVVKAFLWLFSAYL